MTYNEQKGNLFELDKKYALAHCISLDCAMGAGIALAFDRLFKGMKNECIMSVVKYNLYHPNIVMYEGINGQIVFNLISKDKYYNKPTYINIMECIKMLKEHCQHYDIEYLAIPRIGCGLDGLDWNKVREIIKHEFKDLEIEIQVRYL